MSTARLTSNFVKRLSGDVHEVVGLAPAPMAAGAAVAGVEMASATANLSAPTMHTLGSLVAHASYSLVSISVLSIALGACRLGAGLSDVATSYLYKPALLRKSTT